MTGPWHEDNEFWETFEPALFTPRHWEEASEDVDALLTLTGLAPPARVLDLCCGPGRHALPLARRGFQVTGLDRTAAFLQQGRRLASAESLDVEWLEADARELAHEGRYQLCVNLYTSLGYFSEQEELALVERVRRSLLPEGQFVVETVGKEVLARVFEPQEWCRLEDGSFLLQERQVTGDWDRVEARWILIRQGEVHEHQVTYRLYSARELREMLLAAGFDRVDVFGDLEGTPYDNEARRLVALAR